MAEINNLEDFKESFDYITDALDSMRAQNALNAGNFDKVLNNINNQLEVISSDENVDLIKVFLGELKRSLDERHTFVSSKFTEIEDSFSDLVTRSESQLKAHEIKELFEIIANNLTNFSTDFSAQKDLINAVGLKIEEFHQDESQKKEILKNIAVLKSDIEKLSPGFESIIVNVNDHFKEIGEKLIEFDTKEDLSGIKKDIENIFVSSNAVLSALQVIDHKNRELEDVITHLVTKEDFNLERDQVAKLILQNIELTNYINTLPKQDQMLALTDKVDTTVGVLNALKNMITETGKQNQELLTAQLDNLEKKILNISTEEEFIGFRKELSEFATQVIESSNMMRADLEGTNAELKGLLAFLNSVDIKNSFINFAKLSKISEDNIQKTLSDITGHLSSQISEKQELTKENIDESIVRVDESINTATEEIKEHSKLNLATITEHIQSVVNSIFQVKNAIQVENAEQVENLDAKFQGLKEDFTNSSNFIVNNSQENLENILSNIEKVFQEIVNVKEDVEETSSNASQNVGQKFEEISSKINSIKEDLGHNSRESFENILSLVNDFSRKIAEMQEFLKQNTEDSALEMRGQALALAEKFSSIQDTLTKSSEINFSQTQEILEELIQTTKSAKAALEQTSITGLTEVKSNIEVIAERLEAVHDDFDIKSQNNLARIVSLFEDVTREFNENKSDIDSTVREKFESISGRIQELSSQIRTSENSLSEEFKASLSELQNTISSIPERIRENQGVFEDEKRLLIEENSRNISEMGEKVQDLIKSLVARENPFKGEVLFELSELKSAMEKFKEGLNESNIQLGEKVEDEVNQVIRSVEDAISKYDEKHDLALLSLQNKLTDYFESLQQSASETDIKLNNSLREISDIKPELVSIIDGIHVLSNDSSVAELSTEVGKKFDGILLNITQLEEIFSGKNKESLDSVLASLQERFEGVSDELKSYKNITSSELEGFIEDLVERFEIVKSQINLTNTDILNILTAKTGEITSWLSSIKESINQVLELNVEELVLDIKKKIETSSYELSSSLKEEFKQESQEHAEAVSQNFETLNDKLDRVLSNTSSTSDVFEIKNTLEELSQSIESAASKIGTGLSNNKLIIDQIDNIENLIEESKSKNIETINEALQTLLSKINELSLGASEMEENVSASQREFSEKLSTIESNLLSSQNEKKSEIIDKIIEAQNVAKDTLMSDLEENITSIKENFHLSTQSLISKTIANSNGIVIDKIGLIQESINEVQEESKETLDKLLEIQNESKNSLTEILEENISSMRESISALNVSEEITDNLSAKIDSIRASISLISKEIESQLLNAESNAHATTKAIITQITDVSEEKVFDKLNSLEEKVLEGQSESKAELFENIKESVAQSIENAQQDLTANQGAIKAEIFEKIEDSISQCIENVQQDLTTNQISIKTSIISEIKENIAQKIENIQQSFSANQNTVKTEIIEEIKDDLAQNIENIQEKLTTIQNTSKEILLDELKDSIISIKNEISSLSLDADFVEEFSQKMENIQNTVSAAVKDIDYSNASVTEKIDSLEDKLLEAQDSARESIIDKIVETQTAVKSDLIAELEDSMDSIKENYHLSTQSLVGKIVDASNDNLYEKLEALQDKLVEGQDQTRNAVIYQLKEYLESSELDESLITEVSKRIEAIQNKIVLEHEETKQAILDELQDNINLIKESLSSTSLEENLKREFAKNLEDSDERLSQKLENIEEKILESQDETKTAIFDELQDNINSIKEQLESLNLEENVIDVSKNINASTETISQTIESLQEKLLEGQDEVKMTIFNELKENINTIKEDLESLNIDEKVIEELSNKIETIESKLLESVEETKEEIIKEVSKAKSSTEAIIVEELNENINVIKDILESVSTDDKSFGEISEKIALVEETITKVSEEIQGKISDSEDNYKTSTQGLLSEIKTTFWEKVDDSIDELRSFLEVVESKKDFSGDLDNLKAEIFDKFSDISEEFEASIKAISVKDDLDDLHKDINSSLDNLFGNLEDKVKSVFEDSKILSEISSQNDEANRRIEDLKKAVIEDINSKLDGFELSIDGQKKDFTALIEELKGSISELKENFIDLNLNSSMEISGIFSSVQEQIESIEGTLKSQNYDKKFDELSNKIENINLSGIIDSVENKISSIEGKIDNIDLDSIAKSVENKIESIDFEKSTKELVKEFEVINQKLDLFAAESNSDVEESIKEIKQIVQTQSKAIDQLNKLTENDSVVAIQKEIQKSFKDFEAKLETLSQTEENNDTEEIKKELKSFKQEFSENIIELFNQISFVVEAEEIKDFVEEKTEEIKEEIIDKIKHIRMQGGSSEAGVDSGEIKDLLEEMTEEIKAEFNSKLKGTASPDLDFETEEIKDFIEERTGEIKDYLKKLQSGLEAEEDYSYTLQDVESDIAKVRMILNDIIKAKEEHAPQQPTDDFEKLNDNLMSISTRTNKLLLNSDESYSVLKENLTDFRNIVYQLEERIKKADTKEAFAKIDKKMDNLNNLVLSCVKSDKLFNQSFMYLAQWIDSTSENLETIQENAVKTEVKMANVQDLVGDLRKTMPKRVDVDNVLDEISERFDKQQARIDSLELKIEKLLDLVENGASKVDSKANKKIDSIDKQLTKLSKSIEMLTSYVDEG